MRTVTPLAVQPPRLKRPARLPLRTARRKNDAGDAGGAEDATAKVRQQPRQGCRVKPSPIPLHPASHACLLPELTPAQKRVSKLTSIRAWNELNSMQKKRPRSRVPPNHNALRPPCLLRYEGRALSTLRQCYLRSEQPTAAQVIRRSHRDCRGSNPCCVAWSPALCTTSIKRKRRPRGPEFFYCRTPTRSRRITWRLARPFAWASGIWCEARGAAKHRAEAAVDIPIPAA